MLLLIRFIVISAAKIQSYFDITKQKQSFFCFYIKIFCFTYYIYVCRLQGSHTGQHVPTASGLGDLHTRHDLSSSTP